MHQPQTKKKKAFTLVELIIVITILAILGTIAFISFQGYTKDTRDSVRLTDVKSIYDGLSIYKIQTSTTLLPDDYIEIQSGTTTISYQGYAGDTVQRGINLKNGGIDPLSKNYYIYTTDVSAKKIQLLTYLETADKDVELLSYNKKLDNLTNNLKEKLIENNLINQAYSANTDTGYYLDKKIYVYGDKIGILTDENNVPLQETITSTGINLLTNTGNIITYFGGDVYDGGKSTSTGVTLVNEINGAINNTLPCSPTTHEGYSITSLQDSQSGTFTKVVNNSPHIQTGSIIATCDNGVLSYSNEVLLDGCSGGYNWNGSSCIPYQYALWNNGLYTCNYGSSCVDGSGYGKANKSVDSGKWYWEIKITGMASCTPGCGMNGMGFGISTGGNLGTTGTYYFNSHDMASSHTYCSGTTCYSHNFVVHVNDVISIRLDLDSNNVYFDLNGSQIIQMPIQSGTYYPAIWFNNGSSNSIFSNFGQANFQNTIPNGYNPGFYSF